MVTLPIQFLVGCCEQQQMTYSHHTATSFSSPCGPAKAAIGTNFPDTVTALRLFRFIHKFPTY